MDLRTKLVFALVAVALGSMLAFGWFAYGSARGLLRDGALEHLEAVAESKQESVERLLLGWRERVQLVASRTQLRGNLRNHLRTGSSEPVARLTGILDDALRSTTTIESLAVFDPAGRLVASVQSGGEDPAAALGELPGSADPEGYRSAEVGQDGDLIVVYAAHLVLDDERLGTLWARLRGDELIRVTGNVEGLGATGETLVAFRDPSGTSHVLHPVRHDESPVRDGIRTDERDPLDLALDGTEGLFSEGMVDYRGETVWAATRHVPETGWGLVVKVDEDERRAPVVEFRRDLQQLGLSLAAFAILVGTLLGLHFAKPFHELVEVVQKIRSGDLGARAVVRGEDEIDLLAKTFNDMTDELAEQLTELREFHKYFDVALDMLCIAGTDGYFKRTNPAFERTLGWTQEELASRPFFDFVHPDDMEATQREVAKLAEGIPTVRFENRYRCADGSYKTLLWTSHPEAATGLLYAAARDISELKRAREKLAETEDRSREPHQADD